MTRGPITEFMLEHYRHFNAAAVIDAARAWEEHLAEGGKMFVTLAGAMSTAELGLSLAEMIRQDKVHAISCTGANLEEDVFNLVAHDHYERVPHYRDLSPTDEEALLERAPEPRDRHLHPRGGGDAPHRGGRARRVDGRRRDRRAPSSRTSSCTEILRSGELEEYYQIDPKDTWLLAAAEKNLPIFVPGWEDSTLGNMFAGHVHHGRREERAHRAAPASST